MFVREIHIRREDDYGYGKVNPDKPLIVKVKVEGSDVEQTLTLSAELSAKIIGLIQEDLVEAAQRTARMMSEAITLSMQPALPAPSAVRPSQDSDLDDEIPF